MDPSAPAMTLRILHQSLSQGHDGHCCSTGARHRSVLDYRCAQDWKPAPVTSSRFRPEGEIMTTTPDTSTLSRDQRARYEEAQVQADEANARKAAADAAMSELTLTQARYKALVPDLTGVATNAVTDKSAGVAFSGLVTHSALNNAAKDIADRIAAKLTGPVQGRQPVILVTSQTDLLTSDLLSTTVKACLKQLLELAKQVLAPTEPTELTPSGIAAGAEQWFSFLLPPTTAGVAAPSGAAAAGVVGLAAWDPSGWPPPRPPRFPRSSRCSPRPPRSRTTPKTSQT